MRHTTWFAAAMAVAALAITGGDVLAKKGGGGKPGGGGDGGDPGNTTPLDILYQTSEGSGYGTLFAMQDDGTGSVQLAATRGGASWSPDGTQVAYYGYEDGFGVYVMDVDGGTPQKLIAIEGLTAGYLDWCPVVEPDGTHKIVFTSRDESPNGYADLFVAHFDDTGLIEIEGWGNTPGNETGPSWSPSGEQIAFNYHQQIRVLDLADRDANGVPSTHVVYESTVLWPYGAQWARTSNTLAFASKEDGTGDLLDLYVMPLSHANGAWTGGTVTNVTNSPKDEENGFSWSPDDSQLLAFNVYWRRPGSGTGKGSLQLIDVATGARQTLGTQGHSPRWRRATQ
jgi:Tol biopolymer transport system component